jgi:curved DNA-binding protein CbpA
MSSSLAGKFQDHYIVLGIETNSDSETIQNAYAKLAQKYHPNNDETGDQAKFDSLNQAYEVLSDPGLRASFDKVKGVDHEAGNPKFTGAEFFRALEKSALLRSAVLSILYDRRRIKSFKPSLSMRHLEGMLSVEPDELNFALWYLKKRGYAINDDKSSIEITVDGMDYLEQNRPLPEAVLPFIKPEALTKQPVVEPKSTAPVLNALNRALQRSNSSDEAPVRSR